VNLTFSVVFSNCIYNFLAIFAFVILTYQNKMTVFVLIKGRTLAMHLLRQILFASMYSAKTTYNKIFLCKS
jgi:hypothetical protein